MLHELHCTCGKGRGMRYERREGERRWGGGRRVKVENKRQRGRGNRERAKEEGTVKGSARR